MIKINIKDYILFLFEKFVGNSESFVNDKSAKESINSIKQ